jgi:ubiquinone/menaquinone biosynthesis C-methylase UbiE
VAEINTSTELEQHSVEVRADSVLEESDDDAGKLEEAEASTDQDMAENLMLRTSENVLTALREQQALPVIAGVTTLSKLTQGYYGHRPISTDTRERAAEIDHDAQEWLLGVRQDLLDKFAENPDDDTIWQTAYSWVTTEEDIPARWTGGDKEIRPTVADDIPGGELIELARTVRSTAPEQRYDLMVQRASNGQRWFDVLQTFSSSQLKKVEKSVIGSWVHEGGRGMFHRALDIGTGTGKSLPVLEGHADEVVGLDRNQTLLDVAKEAAGRHTTLIQGEVDKLPFSDSSFDLIASSGLSGALDKATAIAFYQELARVMTDDGIYIEGSYYTVDGYPGEELARITATSKAMLADMIVDTVSGKLNLADHLEGGDTGVLLAGLGLHVEYYDIPSEDQSRTHNLITIITKDHETESTTELDQEVPTGNLEHSILLR